MSEGLYGAAPADLAPPGRRSRQFSPFVVGAHDLAAEPDGALARMVVLAPPGTLERRYVVAQAVRVTAPGCELVCLAPKDRGGARLKAELEAFGCEVAESARRHHRICVTRRPAEPRGLAEAIAEGGPQIAPRLGLWSQPGVFSWDRPDPGSTLLADHLAGLTGAGADLGCGVGVLALAALAAPRITALTLVDIDARAIAAARRNLADTRAAFLHADARLPSAGLEKLDFVITNPPFHEAGAQDRGLGQGFVRTAAAILRKGGILRLVANVALPYEATLAERFAAVRPIGRSQGFKLLEARK